MKIFLGLIVLSSIYVSEQIRVLTCTTKQPQNEIIVIQFSKQGRQLYFVVSLYTSNRSSQHQYGPPLFYGVNEI